MASETIVAAFRTAAEAETTAAELRSVGVSTSAIEIHKEIYHPGGQDAELAQPSSGERSGFWGWLMGEGGYKDEQNMYERTIAGGGAVLSVVVSHDEADRTYALIEAHHPADIEERSDNLGSAASDVGVASGAASLAAPSVAATGATAARTEGETIALAEEQLTVGKREVQGGTARIRRYVVERPVEEQIKLRTESLRVERRPVSGTATVAADAFTDKVIEVRQTAEEAVVSKTARVVEEVVIGKDVSERTETVRDTVRREEIEVTKDGGVLQDGTTVPPVKKPGI